MTTHELNVKNARTFASDCITPAEIERITQHKVNFYKAHIKKEHGKVTVTMTIKGKPFSFNDVINEVLPEGYPDGGGAETFRHYRNRLRYKYCNGWNVYKIS